MRGAVLSLAALMAAPVAAHAAAGPPGTAVGRIVFRDATHEARPDEVERMRWGHLAVELRRGWQVYPARLDPSGLFTVSGPPGTYRLEYIRIGELAEFFPVHEVTVRRGAVTCVGTIEVAVRDLAQDVGNNTSSTVRVRDDCAAIAPALRSMEGAPPAGEITTALARPARAEEYQHAPLELMVGLRLGAGFSDARNVEAVRADYVYQVGADNDHGNMLIVASGMRVGADFINERWSTSSVATPVAMAPPAATAAWGAEAGVGYSFGIAEGQLFGGFMTDGGRGAHGPLGGVGLRIGSFLFGFGLRYEAFASGDHIGSFVIDISPVGLLGSLL